MSLRARQNNEWVNMSEGIQWKMDNEWHRHSSVTYPDHYVLNPSDWQMSMEGVSGYWGRDPYIVIPAEQHGYPIHSATLQVEGSPLGVATGAAKLQSTDYMFYGMWGQSTIELDYFFTPDVIYMDGMFEMAEYEHLDLRSFDTTKCVSFMGMFYGTYSLITLDISSFDIDTINYDDITYMFMDSSVQTVYVKNQQIADYLDMHGGGYGINFVVGSST